MMDVSGITYQRLEEKHLKDVQFLFLEVFNKKVSLVYLKAKYATDYTRVRFLCTIAYNGDLPIGFYGALPQLFSANNSPFLVVHACDSFTLASYQGKGIHFRLAKLAYELMQQHQVKMVYAFHSENTYYSTKKLGWLSHQELERYHIPVASLPFAKLFKKIGFSKSYQEFVTKRAQPFLATNEHSKESTERITQLYDAAFMNYKNSFQPHFWMEFHGCHFFVKADSVLHIGFFTYPSIAAFEIAVDALKKWCKNIGVNELLFQVSSNSKMSKALQSISAPQSSWLIGYLPFEELNINDYEFCYADLDTF